MKLLYIKRFFKKYYQKLVRDTHTSDEECWDLFYYLSVDIYKKLKEFRRFQETKGIGIPVGLSNEKWLSIIDEMLFAFWYIISEDGSTKIAKEFKKTYGDIYEEDEKYNDPFKIFKNKETGELSNQKHSEEDETIFDLKCYYNKDLHMKFEVRKEKGLKLFSKYFQNLCD